jgi:3-dehydroquinate synthase
LRVRVQSTRPYDVVVEPTLAGLRGAVPRLDEAVLVSDTTVGPLWSERLQQGVGAALRELRIPAGPEHKTLASWERVVDGLLRAGVDRGTPVIAFGGGGVGDIAGFAAATTLRGLPLVQVPTTLLAMVDASVGGKTAVDHPLGRNLIGAFHQPVHVHAALETLSTLPARELRSGLAEVVKTGLVGAPELLDDLERDPAPSLALVARCVAVKAAIVAADEHDRGARAVLNAGHTVGHALEAAAGPDLLHGEAVAIGLVAEARWAVAEGVCEDVDLPDRVAALLRASGLPTEVGDVDEERVLAAMGVDKKGRGDMLSIPLPVRAGRYVTVDVPRSRAGTLLGRS